MDLHKEAEKLALKFIERVIAQAYAEGATAQAIDSYLLSLDPPVVDPDVWRARVEAKKAAPLLGEIELRNLGGRDTFRAKFGLPPAGAQVQEKPDFPYTESGDAEFFAHKHKDDLRYDHLRERWLCLNPKTGIWVPDDIEHVMNLAKESIRARQDLANAVSDRAARTEAQKWTNNGESRARLTNTLALAVSHPFIADSGHNWDKNPLLLGCLNGVVELDTGKLRTAKPEERVTMRTAVDYKPDAVCPKWEDALLAIFSNPNDQDEQTRVIEFMQRALGYSLTGDCREECCFFTWGEGGNGKGTIMNTVGTVVGDYLDDMPYSTLEKQVRGGGIPNDVAKLAGKRFVTCAEVNEFTLNEARLKAITGRDPITARFLHKEFFTFIPVCKIWIATNNKPRIVGQDDGIWRRIHLIPFNNKFTKEDGNINTSLKDELQNEKEGILAWMVRGSMSWVQMGLQPPRTVQVATEQYRLESDLLSPFIDARVVIHPEEPNNAHKNKRTKASLFWDEYLRYCNDLNLEDHQRLSSKKFYQSLRRRFETKEVSHVAFVLGVGLRAPGDAPQGSNAPF